MKFHMAIYTLALVFFKALVNLLTGVYAVDSLTMLQMLLVSMAVAILESFLFPDGQDLPKELMPRRTVWWALMCNVGFLGGALAFRWFAGVPAWGAAILLVWLELGLAAMWFGLHVALKKDTRQLNKKLLEYQERP